MINTGTPQIFLPTKFHNFTVSGLFFIHKNKRVQFFMKHRVDIIFIHDRAAAGRCGGAVVHALRWQYTSEGSMSSFKLITWNKLWSLFIEKIRGKSETVDLWTMSARMCMQFRCALLRIKKALGIFTELIPRTRKTTRVSFWDPPSGSKKMFTFYNDELKKKHSRFLVSIYIHSQKAQKPET